MSIRLKANRRILSRLRAALEMARFERMSLSKNGRAAHDEAYTTEVREATRIYRESYIIAPLEQAIAEMVGTSDL